MAKISYSIITVFILFAFTFTGCGKNETEVFNEAASLQSSGKYTEAIALLKTVANSKTDSTAAKAKLTIGKLFQMQITPQVVGNALLDSAVNYYTSCYINHPKTKVAEEALFLAGFINANDLQNFTKATELYNTFLQLYPGSPYAVAVKQELEVMGLSPEEILQRKLAKQ